ncbi:unnamed protein product [Parajaminaea phylloscopi]
MSAHAYTGAPPHRPLHPLQQPVSGLRALKRSWSGSSHDLGEDDQEEVKVAPTKAQRQLQAASANAHVPGRSSSSNHPASSSDGTPLDGSAWDPTPPEKQRQIRQSLFRYDENGIRTSDSVSEDDILSRHGSRQPAASSSHSHSQKAGVRVSGLSRSISRTPSMDAEAANAAGPADSVTTARQLPPGFQPLGRQQLIDKKRQRAEAERQQAESSSSKSRDPSAEYRKLEDTVPGMFRLSNQQLYVRNLVVQEGKSVFFTGSAGTGKSVLLRDIIKLLKKKYEKRGDAVAVTASTGIAACNIGGVTLHSFAGIGLGAEDVGVLVRKIRRNRKAMGRWARTQVLIVDEISMVEPDLLDKLDAVGRALRKSPNKAFGGLQLVITGDFFQLPPVMKGHQTRFAFEAKMWDDALDHKVNLTQVFRQKDETFVRMLNEMRHGKLSQDSIDRFRSLTRPPVVDDTIVPTDLFPHREDVDRANMSRLAGLKVSGQTYEAKDGGELPRDQRDKILSQFMAPPKIFLKVGAQVMLIKNTDETLVNGSVGKVVAFLTPSEHRLALLALPNLYHDEHLQKLPALQESWSFREASPEKGAIAGGGGAASRGDGMEASKRKQLGPAALTTKWPLVRFTTPNGGHRTELVKPEEWKNELPNGEVQASRVQLPLILAWAMSIHKSQGQTMPCCRIDLGKVFEKGQAYVALSRATSLEGLQVLNFNPQKVMAHPRVIEWSKSLATMTAPTRLEG